jgi:tripartite-type tricarboxylate transporter receptor subunit TctC
MHKTGWLLAATLAGALGSGTATAADQPFYTGKTIHFIVGFAPGGGSDIMCRLLASAMTATVPGRPTIVVQNMPGADGNNAANYVAEVARPDGQTALCGTVAPLSQLLKDPSLRVDLRTAFRWIAGVPEWQVLYVRSDVKPGLKVPSDIYKAQGLVMGGFRADSSKDIPERLALDMLGVKYKYVTGINGEGSGRAQLQQNFINTWMDAVGSFVSVDLPTLVTPGTVVPIFQTGMADEHGQLTKRTPAVPDVPTVYELYQEKYGKAPAGPEWDTFQAVLGPFAIAQRGIALPVKVPQEAVSGLSAGVAPLLQDADFLAKAKKVLGVDFSFCDGERVQQSLTAALNPTPAVLKFLVDYVKKGEQLASGH